jgi:hypothetical protein
MRVTFDSHVWQLIVRPDKHPKDKNHSHLLNINEALRDGRIQSFICETVGTLEVISTDRRGDYLAKMRPITDVQVEGVGDGIDVSVTLALRSGQQCGRLAPTHCLAITIRQAQVQQTFRLIEDYSRFSVRMGSILVAARAGT